ncbi:hypothetical protein VKT23_005512 [Stygiomarasmius scandens]|uniref:RING-type domain-containing protein n=1 Tax=Marasmiellus scandens TaxID=2682957 RepID=A0ABR1JWQ1_9AGAR
MGSRKPSNNDLNHLLNFSLPPRQHAPAVSRRSYRKTANQNGIWNKERFVNAQYRFIMNPGGDYTVHFADPDIFFQWHDILQVIIPRNEGTGHTTCPICLSPPTAPRMTKCGHVFCYPCILHYLHTSENKWARCPICFDSINERQLKNVKWFEPPSSPLAPGTLLPMRLIQRPAGTTLALPRSSTFPSSLFPTSSNIPSGVLSTPFHFLPDVYTFSRFMLATPAQLISDLSNDIVELEVEKKVLGGMNDHIGIAFVEGAMRRVGGMINRAKGEDVETSSEWGIGTNLGERIERVKKELKIVEDRAGKEKEWAEKIKKAEEEKAEEQNVPEEFLAIKAGGIVSNTPIPPISKPKHPPNTGSAATQTYYYYQAASGLPIYLHPLDIKILLTHFGPAESQSKPDQVSTSTSRRNPRNRGGGPPSSSHHTPPSSNDYSSLPNTIFVKVDAFSEGTVDEDLRKRCKYLSHLPEGADVCFVEVDWEQSKSRFKETEAKTTTIPESSLQAFSHALSTRKSRRREKGRKDERARVRAEEREWEREWERTRLNGLGRPGEVVRSAPISVPVPVPEPEPEPIVVPSPPSQPQPTSGVWGSRSFASAAQSQSPGSTAPISRRMNHRPQTEREREDEWEMDIAWHELEERTYASRDRGAGRGGAAGGGGGGGGTGKKNKGNGGRNKNTLVVLGGGGGRRR